MKEPKRFWWARRRKLCALERPGGGGRSHRPQRRKEEIDWLLDAGVRTVISTMATRHNLAAYEEAGLRWLQVPGDVSDPDALEELLATLRRELRRPGAVAVHGNRHTDYVAAACAACLHERYGVPLETGLTDAREAGLSVTAAAAALVGVELARA